MPDIFCRLQEVFQILFIPITDTSLLVLHPPFPSVEHLILQNTWLDSETGLFVHGEHVEFVPTGVTVFYTATLVLIRVLSWEMKERSKSRIWLGSLRLANRVPDIKLEQFSRARQSAVAVQSISCSWTYVYAVAPMARSVMLTEGGISGSFPNIVSWCGSPVWQEIFVFEDRYLYGETVLNWQRVALRKLMIYDASRAEQKIAVKSSRNCSLVSG